MTDLHRHYWQDMTPEGLTVDKSDIMASLDREPPFGDFAGFEGYEQRPPVILHTTSGTTGKPQVLLFGPKSREVQNILLARLYRFQGLRPDDIVHSVYGHGMINGGHYVREAVTHWTSAVFLSAGTGVETRSVQQVEIMKNFGATVIVGFADYIKKLATVAREMGLEPGRDIPVRMISGHMGREDKAAIGEAWGGAQCFDWYGVGDTGLIAAEGPDRDGLYVQEDAQYLEVCDIDTGKVIVDGGSDNMVKIRGINIFPQGVGPMLDEHPAFAKEFICRATRDSQDRDSFIVVAEATDLSPATAKAFADILKRKIGIEPEIELVAPGTTAALTQIDVRQKPIRLIDERSKK